MSFDALKVKNGCVQWIRDFFEENGKGCNAIVGISGGKDSSIVAATTEYGEKLTAAVAKGNVMATQFHPEKSGDVGLLIIKNFIES